MFEISKQTSATSTAMDLGKESEYPAVRKLTQAPHSLLTEALGQAGQLIQKRKHWK